MQMVFHFSDDENRMLTTCRQCAIELPPGEGRHWPHPFPMWVPGYGMYLCQPCYDNWKLWEYMLKQQQSDLARIRYWLSHRLANAPAGIISRSGEVQFIDEVALAHARLASIINAAGCAYAAVTLYIANELDHSETPPTNAIEFIDLAEHISQVTINRIQSTVFVPLLKEVANSGR